MKSGENINTYEIRLQPLLRAQKRISSEAKSTRLKPQALTGDSWKPIGPLKREDGSLAVCDVVKTNMMNAYFSLIGTKLAALSWKGQHDKNSIKSALKNLEFAIWETFRTNFTKLERACEKSGIPKFHFRNNEDTWNCWWKTLAYSTNALWVRHAIFLPTDCAMSLNRPENHRFDSF